LKNNCRNAKFHFQMTFLLPSTSCLLKLPNDEEPPKLWRYVLKIVENATEDLSSDVGKLSAPVGYRDPYTISRRFTVRDEKCCSRRGRV